MGNHFFLFVPDLAETLPLLLYNMNLKKKTMQTINIFKPCSPSVKVSIGESKGIKFTVSWGGGMGGSSQTIYATKVSRKGDIVSITSIDGQVYKVTKNFIVMEKDVKIVKLVTDITAHSNYHSKQCNKNILTQYFSINANESYSYNSEYGESPKVIYSFNQKS